MNAGEMMIEHVVELFVPNAKAEPFYEFMIAPCDQRYSAWWPDAHLRFHIKKSGKENHLGDTVFMDEYLDANHRLTFFAVVVTANRPNQIKWQMKKAGIRLPAFVTLSLIESEEGIWLKHELRMGYAGAGKWFDPLIRMYFNQSFEKALEAHCSAEWFRLAEYLAM
jgi:hypothetical protein